MLLFAPVAHISYKSILSYVHIFIELQFTMLSSNMIFSHAPPENVPPSRTSSWEKFRLLLWKNYKIQIRHNVQTVTEILLPLLFTAVLLIVRNVVPSTFVKEPTIYKPITIEGHPPDIVQTSWYDSTLCLNMLSLSELNLNLVE